MDFQIPSSLDGLDLDALTELENQAVAAFDALRDDTALDADGLARLRELAAFVQSVRTEQARIEQAAEQVASELDDLTATVHGAPEGGDGDGDEGDGGEAEEPAEETPAEEPSEETPAEEPAQQPQPTPVVASLARRAARRQPKPKVTRAGKSAVIKAAADVPNVPHGHVFSSVSEVASAFDDKFAGFPRGVGVATRIKQNVARVELPVDQGLVAGGRGLTDMELVELAASESRLSGGNLVAAGGWGAPSETLWELCEGLETTEGLLDLPGITIPRGGGIKVPANLDFRDLYSGIGFVQTEADSTAGVDKSSYRVPTVNWAETRLEVDGVQIEQDIVQNAVWPELTRDVVRRTLTAHEHKINARLIQRMATAPAQSTQFALTLGGDVDGDETTTALLGAISLAATDYRYRYRLSRRQLLECVAPLWLIDWIRADMSRRAGVNYLDVTDEQITAWFTRRHLRPQFVYDWQDGYADAGGNGFGGSAAPGQWPGTADLLIYAPGTWVKGSKPIIDLSAVYDSTKLKDNEYIALFTEQATLLVKRCFVSYKVSVPLCPTGVTGSTVAFDCSAA
ncbi:major capsid protein [Micromonospora aurantiaca (nom. illeg.)]|uniref:major capsid protein n=1 Tax=Micromonospora aurantiaca (nom. illeg.) TaxID=47850 RepID=UPI0016570AC1|nr:major capsid protein [Micromonospora aurantiaca]MBC9004119.1 major capsid protein [Micromonospora aurantiaca]